MVFGRQQNHGEKVKKLRLNLKSRKQIEVSMEINSNTLICRPQYTEKSSSELSHQSPTDCSEAPINDKMFAYYNAQWTAAIARPHYLRDTHVHWIAIRRIGYCNVMASTRKFQAGTRMALGCNRHPKTYA